mgnify:CR=1 FL=1
MRRRHLLYLGTGATLALATHGCTQGDSKSTPNTGENPGKITIGFWPVASGLPLFVADKKGYFKEAGLNVEVAQFASPNQVAIWHSPGCGIGKF